MDAGAGEGPNVLQKTPEFERKHAETRVHTRFGNQNRNKMSSDLVSCAIF